MPKKKCKTKDAKIPEKPEYFCKKCGNEAEKEKHLCKPRKMKD